MARDANQITAEINRLKAARASGVRSVSTAGVSTTFESGAEMGKRIAELQAELADIEGSTPSPKPRIRGINLESAW